MSMSQAALLLTDTDKSITEIMHILNYANRTYFYQVFREKYGMTPKIYRNQNSNL